MAKTTKPKAAKSPQAKSSYIGGKRTRHTCRKPGTEAQQSKVSNDEHEDPTSPAANTPTLKVPVRLVWDKYPKRTKRLLDYLDAHPDVTVKMFGDSTQAAKSEGHSKLTAKLNKGAAYLQLADGIFSVNSDSAIQGDFATNSSKYTKAVDNYITNTLTSWEVGLWATNPNKPPGGRHASVGV
jgi:hypothetical protein